jgi:hypothetical protein
VSSWPEDEVTPPPVDLPLDHAAPISDQLEMLRAGLAETRRDAYDNRVRSERLDRLDDTIGGLAKSVNQSEALLREYLGPQLDHWRAVTDGIAQQLPQLLTSTEALAITLRNLDERVRSMDVSLSVSIGKLAANADAVAARVTVLEHNQAAQALRLIEIEKRAHGADEATKALARHERRKTGALSAVVASVIGVVHAVVSHFTR